MDTARRRLTLEIYVVDVLLVVAFLKVQFRCSCGRTNLPLGPLLISLSANSVRYLTID